MKVRLSVLVGALVSLLLVSLPSPPAAAQEGGQLAVTAAVQVTANPAPVRAHSSPRIAVNPRTGELVVVESDVRGGRACAVHISADGGKSWFPGGDPMADPYTDCGFFAEYGPYANLAFAGDGTLYIAFVASEFLTRPRDATPRHVFLARSRDGGRTFATARVFEAPDGNPDRGLNKGPMLAVDPSDPSRVYVGWRQGVFRDGKEKLKSNVAASHDGGETFGPPVDLTDDRGGDYPGIAVDGEGVVHAVYWTRVFPPTPPDQPGPVRPIMYVRSTDGGKTFSEPREADRGNQSASRPPLLAADPSSGALYLLWHANEEADNGGEEFQGDLDVFLRSSHDGGATWSDRVVVNDDGTEANQYEPGIAIAPNGRVDVAWYDFRNSPTPPMSSSGHSGDTGISDVYYAWSADGGRSFSRNVRVNDRSIDRSMGVWSNNVDSKFNVGVASTSEAVHFAWQDTRNAVHATDAEDVYVASATFDEAVPTAASRSGVPWWVALAAGIALGMGLAGVVAGLVARRAWPRPASA